MSDETLEKTFTTAAPARLNLSNIRGSVEIRPGAAALAWERTFTFLRDSL